MSINRVLKGDLSSKFINYGLGIGSIVNEDKCEKFLHVLQMFDHHEEFYLETNLKTQKITWSLNIQKWLGHPDVRTIGEVPMDYLIRYVHPFIRDWYKIYVDAAMLVFLESKNEFLKSRFVINVPIQKSDGQFLLIKQMIMPFGMDRSGKIVSFLNSFTIFGPYQGEPLKMNVFENDTKVGDWFLKSIESLILPHIEGVRRELTHSDFMMLDCIRELKNNNIEPSASAIASLYSRIKGKKIDPGSIVRYLTQTRSKFQWLLHLNTLPEEEGEKYKKDILPDYKDSYRLIDFFEQSGLSALLRRAYYDIGIGEGTKRNSS